jgi:acylpyruvate hydrolase
MKLVRFSMQNETRIGFLSGEKVFDLNRAIEAAGETPGTWGDSMRLFLSSGEKAMKSAKAGLAYVQGHPEYAAKGEPYVFERSSVRLGPPVHDPAKILCIGQNYRDHCLEQNQPFPERPILFAKYPNTLIGDRDEVVLPISSDQVDYEAELAFVIGKRAKRVSAKDALSYVAGYMCLNDVTARDIQMRDKQWVRGKTFDTFAPTGPALVTSDEAPNPGNLNISLTLNGVLMQNSNTSNLIFGIERLVHNLSEDITLEPGDIVTTGTPGGVGVWRKPPIFLKDGDVVSMKIEGLGSLTNRITKG